MKNVYDILNERGFVEQVTDRDAVRKILEEPTTCYIGFDPTAKSLHIGSLLPIMSLAHMQKHGHKPIVVQGGGTALVGDPSGKDEIRPVLSMSQIDENAAGIKGQLSRFIDFTDGRALMLNNANWLLSLRYIDFLRDIGRHFSVNRMLAAESYRQRLKTGLSFLEFNYMPLQAYDFWYLYKSHNCVLQMGGNDQWGNILAGTELTRRLEGKTTHGLTFPLITTADGFKMGKTNKGAVWLDPELTSPYEYYQYWINVDDRDAIRFLLYFTFVSLEDIRELSHLKGEDIRKAKEILAHETTKLCHGQKEADMARKASKQLFSQRQTKDIEGVPGYTMSGADLGNGIQAYVLLHETGLCKTRGEARRLIAQGGAYINETRIPSFEQLIGPGHFQNNIALLRTGKKNYLKVYLQN